MPWAPEIWELGLVFLMVAIVFGAGNLPPASSL